MGVSRQIGLVTSSVVNLWRRPDTSQGVSMLPRRQTHPDVERDGISQFLFQSTNSGLRAVMDSPLGEITTLNHRHGETPSAE